ncbi:CmcI family methyltransferase [Maricaulis sp.]|uniref:CmcI family methyltransferase n=1 Tax=Maricaulis sp. TaxID=1486257 RepID=UPI003A8D40BE
MTDIRSFNTAFPETFLKSYQDGVMRYTYRGVRCLKSPVDIAIYMKLLWDLKPNLIVEVGSHSGGSALMLADLATAFQLKPKIVSIDLARPEGVSDDRVTFVEGDVSDLEAVFSRLGLGEVPHPWFVSEDSAHTFSGCLAALKYLASVMTAGDILSMEDGVLDELNLSERYDGGPNRAIRTFLEEFPGCFEIDTALCDMFGTNATYNPNGYLRKL